MKFTSKNRCTWFDNSRIRPVSTSAAEWAKAYEAVFPEYALLIESYTKARQVEHDGEQLDYERA